jgi:hypothetical protein
MKFYMFACVWALAGVHSARAQCSFTDTLSGAASSRNFDNRTLKCVQWTLDYWAAGIKSPFSMWVEGAPDSGGSPGTFVALQATTGDNPTSSILSPTRVQFTTSDYGWLRVRIETFTGTGTVDFTLQAPAPAPPVPLLSSTSQLPMVNRAGQLPVMSYDNQSFTFDQSLAWDNYAKRLLIGPDLGVKANLQIYHPEYVSTSGDLYGQYINWYQAVPTTGVVTGSSEYIAGQGATGYVGTVATVISAGSSNVSYVHGFDSVVGNWGPGTATIDRVIGYYNDMTLRGPGIVNEAEGFTTVLGVGPPIGNVTAYKGFYFAGSQFAGGAVINQYGFYSDDVTGATNDNYAIYTNRGKSRFGDWVGIGTSGYPHSPLEVNGVIQTDAQSTDPGCATTADIGRIWFNNATSTTVRMSCNSVSGIVKWVQF